MQGDIDGWEVKKSKVIDVEIAGRVHGADMKGQGEKLSGFWQPLQKVLFCHRSS